MRCGDLARSLAVAGLAMLTGAVAAAQPTGLAPRCLGAESAPATPSRDVALALLEAPDLPEGWKPSGPPQAPAAEESGVKALDAARAVACVLARDYATPSGSVRVLAAAFADDGSASRAATRMQSDRGPSAPPVVLGGRLAYVLVGADRLRAQAWGQATEGVFGLRGIDAFTAAHDRGDEAEAARRHVALSAFAPRTAPVQAFLAGVHARRGNLPAAKEAAAWAAERAEAPPAARAEALHWLTYVQYLEGASVQSLLPSLDAGVDAAQKGGDTRQLVRALFDRACARSRAGQSEGALSDLAESLRLEATVAESFYREAAPKEPDLEAVRGLPGFAAALKAGT